MEQEQREIIYGPGTLDNKNTALLNTTALVVKNVDETESRVEKPVFDKQEIVEVISRNQLMKVIKMISIQWKNLNNWKIRQCPIW